LLTEYKVKLGDFGFAKEISYADEKLTEYCGTPSYAAPEVSYQFLVDAKFWEPASPLSHLAVQKQPRNSFYSIYGKLTLITSQAHLFV
jgi:serine/threonine protein kinase